jgi:glutaredoxin
MTKIALRRWWGAVKQKGRQLPAPTSVPLALCQRARVATLAQSKHSLPNYPDTYRPETMRFFIRTFFKALRLVLGPLMLLWEFVTRPKGIVRPPAAQQQVDMACGKLALYQFKTCPFCIKVRQEMRRLSLTIVTLDAQFDESARNELLRGGGEIKVPCLRVTDESGAVQWMYESGAIINYLRQRFPAA